MRFQIAALYLQGEGPSMTLGASLEYCVNRCQNWRALVITAISSLQTVDFYLPAVYLNRVAAWLDSQ